MPEQANPELRQPSTPTIHLVSPSPAPYAELSVTTNFSFLTGASHPDELAIRAAELGYRAIAVTDCNSLAGAVRMHVAAKTVGLKFVAGARLTFSDYPSLLVWPMDRPAYARLSRLLTAGKRRAEKGECLLSIYDFIGEDAGLFAAVIPPMRYQMISADWLAS